MFSDLPMALDSAPPTRKRKEEENKAWSIG
jgi:hypothetical protein